MFDLVPLKSVGEGMQKRFSSVENHSDHAPPLQPKEFHMEASNLDLIGASTSPLNDKGGRKWRVHSFTTEPPPMDSHCSSKLYPLIDAI